METIKLKVMFWNKDAQKHQQPGKHYIVERVINPVLGTIPWVNDKYIIWRQLTITIDGDIYTMGCQRAVKHKNRNACGWYIDADKFSPAFDTIPELLAWASDKVIKGTCGDGSGSYHIRINQTPQKHEIWI